MPSACTCCRLLHCRLCEPGKTFRWPGGRDFDECGVLWHLATEGGARRWQNPAVARGGPGARPAVAATRSSDAGGSAAAACSRAGRQGWTHDRPGQWWAFDLGPTRRVSGVTHYALRHGYHNGQPVDRPHRAHRAPSGVLDPFSFDRSWARCVCV